MQGKIVIFEIKYGTGVTSGEVVLMPTGADKINGLNNPVEITKQGVGGILLATPTTFDWLPYDVIHDNKIIVTDGVEIVKANNIEFNGSGVTISQKGDSGVIVNITGSGGTSTIDHFTELKDTPDAYTGQSGKYLQVNGLENSLQFADIPKDTAEQIVTKISGLKDTNDALSYTALKDKPNMPTIDTAEQIARKLETLQDDKRLSYTALKDIPNNPNADTPQGVRDKLQTLTGNDRLDSSAIKNLPSSSIPDMLQFKTGLSIKALNTTGQKVNGGNFAYVYPLKDGGISEAKLSTAVAEKLNKTGATFSLADTGVTGVTYSNGAFTVTHNFNTQAVAVVMRDSTNGYRQVPANNDAPTVNTVKVYFADQPTNNQYKVTIIPMVF